MHKINKVAVAILLTISTATAFAQSNRDSGFYGLGQMGTTKVSSDYTGTSVGDGQTQGNGWLLGLGYDFNKYLAVEGSYGQIYKGVNSDNWRNASGSYVNNSANTMDARGYLFSALGKVQVTENVRFFAGPSLLLLDISGDSSQKYINGNYTKTSSSSTSISQSTVGITLGSAFALDRNTDLRISYTRFNDFDFTTNTPGLKETDSLSTLLLGLAVKF